MRENVEQARDRIDQPISIGFFGANISHWQIRFAPSGSITAPNNAANRTIIAYKQFASDQNSFISDPLFSDSDLTNNYLITGYWRENQSFGTQCPTNSPNCYKLPEDALVGVMTDLSNTTGSGDWEFDLTTSPGWVTSGVSNTSKSFTGLLGYEADRIFSIGAYQDRTWSKISESVFVGAGGSTPSHSVFYEMSTSHARVFAAGTIQWAWGLDTFGADSSVGDAWHANLYNPDVEIVTQNVLGCLKDGGAAC